MTSAISSFGTLLKREDVTVGEVKDISGPGLSVGSADVTTHESTGGWREKLPTIKDSGDITFEINYVPSAATHKNSSGGLLYDLNNDAIVTWSVTFPDTSVWSTEGFVTGFEPGAPVDGVATASITITCTGQPTLA